MENNGSSRLCEETEGINADLHFKIKVQDKFSNLGKTIRSDTKVCIVQNTSFNQYALKVLFPFC